MVAVFQEGADLMLLDCKERVEAYFRNMNKYENDIDIHVRFLDKIFHAAMDNYNTEEKLWILKELLNTANQESDEIYKTIDFSYCYKINRINNNGLEIPIIRSKETIQATVCHEVEIPPEINAFLEKRPGQPTLKLAENLRPDEELLSLYNVKIAKDHFIYRGSEA